jgi:IS1 family transposase
LFLPGFGYYLRLLWRRIPQAYRLAVCYTDFWEAYKKVIPAEQHRAVGKDSGETAHIERWNNSRLKIRKHFITNEETGFSTSKPCVNA